MEAAAVTSPTLYATLLGRRCVRVDGRDGADYLHRMLTQDVLGLAVERGAPACLLNAEGRVLAHLLVWRDADGLWLDFDAGAAEVALPVLERYVIADDVTFVESSERVHRGRLVRRAAAGAPGPPGLPWPEPGEIRRGTLDGAPVSLLGVGYGTLQACDLRARAEDGERVVAALRRTVEVGPEERLDPVRVLAGVPRFGAELGPDILPNEARLDDAVSFTKGCFPGQEPVVMARHRGHPASLLVRLALETPALPPRGTPLLLEGRAVGRVTTSAPSSGAGQPARALGFVRFRLAVAGTRLALPEGHATVEAWPPTPD